MIGAIIIDGHVQGLSIIRSLGIAGIPSIVVEAKSGIARYSRYCSASYKSPEYTDPHFIDFLLQLGKEHDLKNWILFPTNDHAVYAISSNLQKVKEFFTTTVPEISIVRRIYNKQYTYDAALKSNVPIPATQYPGQSRDLKTLRKLRFPVMIRGTEGLTFYKTFNKKAIIVDNFDHLLKYLFDCKRRHSFENIMVQEIIPYHPDHKVTSFTCFAINGEIKCHWIGEKIREHPVRFGTATMSKSVNIPELLKIATPLIKELNYTGVAEVEFLFDPRDKVYKIIEINARTWLWLSLAVECGVNYPLMIYNYITNKEFDYPTTYETDVTWVHMTTDISFAIPSILKRELSLKFFLNTYKGKKVFAVYSLNDPLPAICELIMLPYLAIIR
jgi:D-aspartate ligase